MRFMTIFSACISLLCVIVPSLEADNWPQWRGPSFNGSSTEKNLPCRWSQTENIAWSVALPGPGAATPIVWGDHVFVSSCNLKTAELVALCFDRKTGAPRWQHRVAEGLRHDRRSSYASPSPATDGDVVVFFYGSGELVAYDFSGQKLWSRNIQSDYGEFAFNWTFASSPLLFDGKLFLQVLQRDVPVGGRGVKDRENKSYLLSMEPKTGKTIWRHFRSSQARKESREAFTSPVPLEYRGHKELLIIGGDDLTGHDPATGKELWRWGTWNPERIGHWRHVPSPVANKDVILVCAPKRDPIYAIRTGGSGVLDARAIAWTSEDVREVSADVPTPAYSDGDFFVLNDLRKYLTRVEPKTGKVKWSIRTPGDRKYEASPLVADGKIYLINFLGHVVVVSASDGKIVHEISMAEGETRDFPVRSSIVAAQGQIFVRTNEKLSCIGK